ncbi:uncharacterized protein LOC121865593 [Homarus americanus]|uniref:uncharacterized protein LOC121865593 n=1 Tax=Homarus americanus TaxID=6706 RepID=UPI001C492584|nr:uncharacterized protein LOC121865593 [Homarus americanus]
MVLAGICSRKIFATSVGLYSSLGLWILTLLMSIVYQSTWWKHDDFFLSTAGWVLGIQIGLLILLPIQMVLAMWELRRQKAGWPYLYFSRVITVETFLLVARVTLGVYAIIFLWNSSLIDGLRNTSDGYDWWESPHVRVPGYFVYPCVIAAAYGVIVSIEGTLSHFSGEVHNKLMACTALMSAICYGGLAVITSPVFLTVILGHDPGSERVDVMISGIFLSIVSCIHAFACMIFPSGIRTPPRFIKKIAEELSSFDVSKLNLNGLASSAAVTNCIEFLTKQRGLYTKVDLVSFTVSIMAVILTSIGICVPYDLQWAVLMMLCGNVAILFRTIPTLVAENFCHQTFVLPDVVRALNFLLENITLFIGAMGSCIIAWSSVLVAAGVINILYTIAQGIFAFVIYKMQKNTEITGVSEDTKVLTESMPEDERVNESWPEGGQIINGLEQGSLSQSYA